MNVQELKEKYFPEKLLLERYREHNRKKEKKYAIQAQKNRAEEDKQTKQILILLKSWGATNVETNGYWFHFNYKGLRFRVVNQEDRVVGSRHSVVHDSEEKEILDRLHMLEFEDEDLYDDICSVYLYDPVHIDGDPVKAFKTLLKTHMNFSGD